MTKGTAKARDEEVKAEKERKVCVSRHALRLSKLNGASKPTGMPSIYTAATTVALSRNPTGGKEKQRPEQHMTRKKVMTNADFSALTQPQTLPPLQDEAVMGMRYFANGQLSTKPSIHQVTISSDL